MVNDKIFLDILSNLDKNDSEVLNYTSTDTAFGIGYVAAKETPDSDCPYENESPEFMSWWYGYSCAKDEMSSKFFNITI